MAEMIKFNVGVRFQPIGDNTKTSESDTRKSHWQLVFTPSSKPLWSLTVELFTDEKNVLSFPTLYWDGERYAHPIGTWCGLWSDIVDLMKAHPMRDTAYSAAYNNCQHWAATLLIFMEAANKQLPGREFDIDNTSRYNACLSVLGQNGSNLYHLSNRFLEKAHLLGVGGGAAAWGAAAIAAEATTTALVPASGIAGWLGVTTAVAVPTAMATVATFALPLTAGAAALTAGTYIYKERSWKNKTTFEDPREEGFSTHSNPLSKKEKGELITGAVTGSFKTSTASSSPYALPLLGSYTGVNIGAISATIAPGAAGILAPSAAVATTSVLSWGWNKFS